MAMLLLAERAGEEARILVLGAGGGLELKALAAAQPDWRFVGVDPSAQMLDLARRVLGPLEDRVELCEGYIVSAPPGHSTGRRASSRCTSWSARNGCARSARSTGG
jgi:tRNA (cmo5U34)-methyltransferase